MIENGKAANGGSGEGGVVQHGAEVLFLLPQEIRTDEKYNVRRWRADGADEREVKELEALGASIERDGQIDAGVVVALLEPDDLGEWYLLTQGHRRRRALTIVNERRTAEGKGQLRMRVVVDRSGGDHLRKAAVGNIQRKNYTPMDLLMLIKRIREEYKWEGFKGAKRVAEYLGVDVATVTQHERFDKADPLLQEKLHDGVLSAQSGFELLSVKPERRVEVMELAEQIQTDQVVEQAVADTEAGRVTPEAAAAKIQASQKRVKHPAVRAAIRQTPDAVAEGGKSPRTRKEILEFFDEQDGPGNGWPDGAVRQWVRYFVDKWAAGEGTDRTCQEKWDVATEKAPKGSKESEPASTKPATTKAAKTPKPPKAKKK